MAAKRRGSGELSGKMKADVLAGRRILLGVAGGIAAYKAADLASKLTQRGALVTAVLTSGARHLVTPHLFEALTGNPCITRMWKRLSPGSDAFPHLRPAENTDLMILAPATAHLIARLAHGLADDVLTTLCLSVRCPVLVCPAMNEAMWTSPAVRRNVEVLKRDGRTLVGPASGRLACGTIGCGRMVEPQEIVIAAEKALNG
jgi:phosphopantothenoylcysteine decarboxylase/phosphopantothenate--cysteine ligase